MACAYISALVKSYLQRPIIYRAFEAQRSTAAITCCHMYMLEMLASFSVAVMGNETYSIARGILERGIFAGQ